MIFKKLNTQDYQNTWQAMREFTDLRTVETPDEIWLLEHPAVFTQGQAGRAEHILNAHNIPIVQSDRGGQVTYHGPGQLIGYCLIDIKRLGIGIKSLVCRLEQALIDTLSEFNITAHRVDNAPGVYVDDKKIAALGLRIRKGCTYHGFSLNVDMDLTPFQWINPCGFKEMQVTQIKDFDDNVRLNDVAVSIEKHLAKAFS